MERERRMGWEGREGKGTKKDALYSPERAAAGD